METEGKMSYVKKVIHSLVVSSPERMTIERLMRDYRSEEGSNVPYGALGFRDFESFLRSIPDTVVLMGYGPMASVLAVATANSAHIQNLVQSQKKPSKRNRAKLKPRFFYSSEASNLRFINESIQNLKRQQQYQQRRYQQPVVHHVPVSCPNYSRLQRPAPVVYPNINALISTGQQQLQQVPYFCPPMLWHYQTFVMLTPLPYHYPQNVPMFPKIPPIPPRENLTRPEVQNRPNPQPQVERPPEKTETEIKELVDSFKKLSTTPTGFIDSLDNAPCVSDDDGWIKDNSSSENEESPQEPEIASPIIKAEESDPQPVSSRPQGATNPFLDYESSDDGSDENAIPAYAVDERVLGVDYPEDCVRSDFKLPVRDASDIFEVGARIEVQLVRVEHPHSFNFWIRNEEYDDYMALHHNMQNCYEDQFPEKYTMPLCLITTDHICAVRSNKNRAWERAKVVRHQPSNTSKSIEVQLVDTGEVMCVGHKDVRHLLKDFATLPPQCLNGRLAFVTPWKGPGWSAEAVKYFFRLVSYRRLYAKVEDVKDNFTYLVLLDPGSMNLNLNKALIESGWVRRCYTT
ncbi:hypothetical protein KR054_005905 [Drosophila jambulina]|nr:hypothetical protein KR054_005905 [Drosophila jambulina]